MENGDFVIVFCATCLLLFLYCDFCVDVCIRIIDFFCVMMSCRCVSYMCFVPMCRFIIILCAGFVLVCLLSVVM